ncbi:MAG: hypothetical protein ACK56I_34320, partial [bacterium]
IVFTGTGHRVAVEEDRAADAGRRLRRDGIRDGAIAGLPHVAAECRHRRIDIEVPNVDRIGQQVGHPTTPTLGVIA